MFYLTCKRVRSHNKAPIENCLFEIALHRLLYKSVPKSGQNSFLKTNKKTKKGSCYSRSRLTKKVLIIGSL